MKSFTRMTFSELRGIFLVIIGVATLIYYYSWWLVGDHLTSFWLICGFVAALFYGTIQILSSWILYLATHHQQPETSSTLSSNQELIIDVFVTACGEDHQLIERALSAACAMHGEHKTWLLDDGEDPTLAVMAQHLGAGYLTRPGNKRAKAGNVNAALTRTQGDVIVIFDIDHVPQPDFLQKTLNCFTDPMVGFVQVMPTFYNNRDNGWVARAASETSLDFYNPVSKGMDAFYSVTKMGSNSLIRRTALDSIGGYQPGLAEDLATSIALHSAGWKSRYVAEPLAPGLAPPILSAWFTQQFKWARGVFEVLLTTYPLTFRQLTWGQRLSYAVRTTKYLIGPAIFVHLAIVIAVLFEGTAADLEDLQQYFVHLTPLALFDMLVRQLALRKWRHPSVLAEPLWRAVTLVYATWPVYTLAWMMAVLRLPVGFRPTPKDVDGNVNPIWLLPQMLSVIFLISGVIHVITAVPQYSAYYLVYFAAIVLAIPQIGLLRPLLRSFLFFWRKEKLNSRMIRQNPVTKERQF